MCLPHLWKPQLLVDWCLHPAGVCLDPAKNGKQNVKAGVPHMSSSQIFSAVCSLYCVNMCTNECVCVLYLAGGGGTVQAVLWLAAG